MSFIDYIFLAVLAGMAVAFMAVLAIVAFGFDREMRSLGR